jgi:hypothetical protein
MLAAFVLPAWMVRSSQVPDVVDRLKAQNDIRTTLVQALGGLVLIAGAWLTRRSIQVNRETQITP